MALVYAVLWTKIIQFDASVKTALHCQNSFTLFGNPCKFRFTTTKFFLSLIYSESYQHLGGSVYQYNLICVGMTFANIVVVPEIINRNTGR
jgi:hypothetical protein